MDIAFLLLIPAAKSERIIKLLVFFTIADTKISNIIRVYLPSVPPTPAMGAGPATIEGCKISSYLSLIDINPATKLVILRQMHRGIQIRPCDYWITAFAGMTGWWIAVDLFNCQVFIFLSGTTFALLN